MDRVLVPHFSEPNTKVDSVFYERWLLPRVTEQKLEQVFVASDNASGHASDHTLSWIEKNLPRVKSLSLL